jgi:hypothetical protein
VACTSYAVAQFGAGIDGFYCFVCIIPALLDPVSSSECLWLTSLAGSRNLELMLFVWACVDTERLRASPSTISTPSRQRLQKEKDAKVGLRGGTILFAFIALVLYAYLHSKTSRYIIGPLFAMVSAISRSNFRSSLVSRTKGFSSRCR